MDYQALEVDDLVNEAARLLSALNYQNVLVRYAVAAQDGDSGRWMLLLGIPLDLSHLWVYEQIQSILASEDIGLDLSMIRLLPADNPGLLTLVEASHNPLAEDFEFVPVEIGDVRFVRARPIGAFGQFDFEVRLRRALDRILDSSNIRAEVGRLPHGMAIEPDVVLYAENKVVLVEAKWSTRAMSQPALMKLLGGVWLNQHMGLPADVRLMVVSSSGFDSRAQFTVSQGDVPNYVKLVQWDGKNLKKTRQLADALLALLAT